MLRLLVVLALVSIGTTSGVSPVQKVIQLIDDMAVKVKKDLDATSAEFEEFAKQCDDEATAKDYAIKSSKEEVEALTATVDDADAKISSLAAKIEDVTTKIGETEGELSDAVSLRDEQHKNFVSTEKEMLDTVDSLNGATAELKKSLGLVQLTSDARQGLTTVLSTLTQIVDANFVTHEQRDKVRAFLQAQEDAEDSLTIKQQEGGSNAIIETLEEMTDRAESTLANTRKAEMEDSHAHAMLKQGIENEIKSMKEELSESTKSKQFNAESKATAEKDLAVEQKGLAEDTQYLGDKKRECQQRATQFEEESRDANAELTALGKAKGILAKKFSALIQTKVVAQAATHDDEDVRAKALRHVEQIGRKYHSTMLLALAYRA
jgi:hypothetical protein